MAVICEKAKKILENHIGLPLDQISELCIHEEAALVKTRTGKNLHFTKNADSRKHGRGNPLLVLNRITTMEEINARIDAL